MGLTRRGGITTLPLGLLSWPFLQPKSPSPWLLLPHPSWLDSKVHMGLHTG